VARADRQPTRCRASILATGRESSDSIILVTRRPRVSGNRSG
jgi:hypothetical protein